MTEPAQLRVLKQVMVAPGNVVVDDSPVSNASSLGDLYRELNCSYPKFHKMDGLCKTGFLAAELALNGVPAELREHMPIILFNRSGSLVTDRNYQRTIGDTANYFPSPALFVYTLANIVTGEIAIRHKVMGETAFYILDHHDDTQINAIVSDTVTATCPTAVLAGWVEYADENHYLADFKLIIPER